MSLGKRPGHLSTTGFVFYLWGCQGGGTPGPGRQFSSRQFIITTGTAGPALIPGSLANGATYAGGGLVPGSWAQVKGTGLSPVSRTWGSADFQGLGNSLPTSLNGVSVQVNGLPAAVYFVDPGQISFQVPNGVSGTASVQVIDNRQTSNTTTAPAAASSPGIFPVIVNGTNYPAGVFLDGEYVGGPAVNPAFRKAKSGDTIQLFAPAGVLPTLQLVNGGGGHHRDNHRSCLLRGVSCGGRVSDQLHGTANLRRCLSDFDRRERSGLAEKHQYESTGAVGDSDSELVETRPPI